MLFVTPSGVCKTRNVRRRPELERWDFEFLTTLKGTPWNPNPAAGEMATDAHHAKHGSPDASTCTSPPGRGGGSARGPCSKQVVHQESRRTEIRLQHELSWMQIGDYGHDCARTVKSVAGEVEECLTGDEERTFGSEAAKFRVDGWLAGRVEPAEKSTRRGDTESITPSGAASSSAPAAAADSSIAAVDQYQSDAVPAHGVQRVRWSPQVQDTRI